MPRWLDSARLRAAEKLGGKLLHSWMLAWSGGYPLPGMYDKLGAHAYEHSALVATVMHRLMSTAGMAKPVVRQLKSDSYMDMPPGNPIQMLLNYPSPKLSRYDLLSHTLGRLHLEGNCFWYLGGSGRYPETIEIIPSRYIWILPNPDNGQVTGYKYETGLGNPVHLQPDEVIHLRKWHPNNAYWGLSTMSAGMIEINGDYAMASWNQNFFGPRNAIPNMAVEVQGQISPKEFVRLKMDWRDQGGVNRETIFFRSGAGFNPIKIHDIGLTPMEASFLEGRRLSRKIILDLFGVPESLFDKDATEASSITAERNYYQRVWEELRQIAESLTLELTPFFASRLGEYVIEFEDIRPVNEELRLKQIETATPFLEINEIRKDFYHKESVEWGDGPASGSGSAYRQFMEGGYIGTVDFESTRRSNNDRAPDEIEERRRTDNPQARGVVDNNLAARAQRNALKALKANLPPAAANFSFLPPAIEARLKQQLSGVQNSDEILTIFDPLFPEPRHKALRAEKQYADWTLRQIKRVPAEQRQLILDAADELVDAWGFSERVEGLSDIPDEVWNAQPQPPGSL